MSEEWLEKLRQSTGLAIGVARPSDSPPMVRDLQRLNDATMRATRLILASPPGEQLALDVELPRQQLNNRIEALEAGLTWTVGLIIVVLLVVVLLLERIVLRPLRVFAAFTRQVQRPERTGGEEFMAVLANTSQEAALAAAERLRAAIEALAVPHSGRVVTISAGVALSTPAHRLNPQRLIEAADQALYAAKKAGRNRVIPAKVPDVMT
ncbi:diguanylate cyclase domain-containing protein [Onishia taeanensis]